MAWIYRDKNGDLMFSKVKPEKVYIFRFKNCEIHKESEIMPAPNTVVMAMPASTTVRRLSPVPSDSAKMMSAVASAPAKAASGVSHSAPDKNWYINPRQTRDSVYERVISNRLFSAP